MDNAYMTHAPDVIIVTLRFRNAITGHIVDVVTHVDNVRDVVCTMAQRDYVLMGE